jgi:CRISPR-associated protein Cas5/DevS
VICLYVQAPFAAFRTFTAGSFRPTAGFITPSAAYGLALNVADIESRFDDGKSAMTLMKPDLPHVKLALGALCFPQLQSLYQQAHNYPIGKDAGAKYIPSSKGNKYNITPTRREFLSTIRAYVCLDENPELEQRIRDGLAGTYNATRYGIPFLGDNNFLVDVLREETEKRPAYWYQKIAEHDANRAMSRTTRLTIRIDRENMANTIGALFFPGPHPTLMIPDNAWISAPV